MLHLGGTFSKPAGGVWRVSSFRWLAVIRRTARRIYAWCKQRRTPILQDWLGWLARWHVIALSRIGYINASWVPMCVCGPGRLAASTPGGLHQLFSSLSFSLSHSISLFLFESLYLHVGRPALLWMMVLACCSGTGVSRYLLPVCHQKIGNHKTSYVVF